MALQDDCVKALKAFYEQLKLPKPKNLGEVSEEEYYRREFSEVWNGIRVKRVREKTNDRQDFWGTIADVCYNNDPDLTEEEKRVRSLQCLAAEDTEVGKYFINSLSSGEVDALIHDVVQAKLDKKEFGQAALHNLNQLGLSHFPYLKDRIEEKGSALAEEDRERRRQEKVARQAQTIAMNPTKQD